MPLYDMKCEACNHEFEDLHGVHEPDPTKCPSCGKPKLKRAWKTAPFYENRYSPLHPRRNRGRGY